MSDPTITMNLFKFESNSSEKLTHDFVNFCNNLSSLKLIYRITF